MKHQHLEMIQGIINRMSGNSFTLKGWAVTLVAGIFALANKDADKLYFLVAYIPIIVFWLLDTYYLLQERLFRALYNKVRIMDEKKIDFNMDISSKEFHTEKRTYCWCLMSATEFGFYFPLAIVTSGIIIISQIM